MTPEAKVKKMLRKRLDELGIKYFPLNDRYASGYPDYLVIYKGLAVAIETKADGESLRPLQRKIVKDWIGSGGLYLVVSNKDGKQLDIVESYGGSDDDVRILKR